MSDIPKDAQPVETTDDWLKYAFIRGYKTGIAHGRGEWFVLLVIFDVLLGFLILITTQL